jgi:hypothetical protein
MLLSSRDFGGTTVTNDDPTGLLPFLSNHARSAEARRLVAEAELLMRRLVAVAKNNRWPLASGMSAEVVRLLTDDLAALTQTTVILGDRLSPGLPPDELRDRLRLADRRTNNLVERLWSGFGPSLLVGLDHEARLWDQLWNRTSEAWFALGFYPWRHADGQKWRHLGGLHMSSVWHLAFFALAFAIAGDEDRFARLARLVELTAMGVIPLCFDLDDPARLIVLMA